MVKRLHHQAVRVPGLLDNVLATSVRDRRRFDWPVDCLGRKVQERGRGPTGSTHRCVGDPLDRFPYEKISGILTAVLRGLFKVLVKVERCTATVLIVILSCPVVPTAAMWGLSLG